MTTVAAAPATETLVPTDDGALLAASVLAPLAPATGTTVLLAHGWGASRRVWSTVGDRLIRAGHRVVTYDQRGHGASTQGREPFGIARLGADLAAVLDHVAAPGALVVGHSGGGFAALSYASSGAGPSGGPGGLVLLGTAAHDQDTPDSEVRMMGSALFQRVVSRPSLGRKLLGQNMLGPHAGRQLREVNRQMFAATAPAVRAQAFRSSRGMDLREALVSVTAPAVVLAGSRDKVIPPRLGRVVAQALPRAHFEELPGAGHMLPLEAPEAVVSAVHELTQGRM
ncbi:alpha/beta fold hydrolase [Streptomyces sp. NBC_00859]|uniref:alpha/beta fold hydrolase n=1 Tax=Streptomyces sp. NBC_00859 TaxID=2903682 RepID=UPI00386A9007|nr:alpha/beta hydrolase [Streptomyces sp. NBC_00859]